MKLKKFTALATAMCMIFSMATSVFATDEVGTQENPEVLTELTGDTISIEGGTSEEGYWGYFYKYTIPEDAEGTIMCSFEVTSSSEEAYNFNVDNLTSGAYASIAPQYYEGVTTASVNAMAGDEIQIKIMGDATWNDDWSVATYSDLTITWVAEEKQVGNATDPEVIGQIMEQPQMMESIITPDSDGYYYSFKNDMAGGVFAIFIDENGTVDPHAMYPDMMEDDPLLVESMDDLKPEITLTNKKTNEVVKYSDGTEVYKMKNMWTGMENTYNIIQIPYKAGEEIVVNLSSGATGYADGVKIVCGLFNFEPFGSYSNPFKLADKSTTAEILAYDAYFIKVNGAYAQFPISVTGEGDFVVRDMFTDKDYTTPGNIVLTQDEYTSEYGFYIVNMTENDATYTVDVDIPLGHELNKEALDTNDKAEVTFEAEDTSMYYFTWTAEEDGIVKFDVTSDNAWAYSVDNTTTGYLGAFIHSYDEKVVHEAIDVSKGDELIIYVKATDKDGAVTKDTKVTTTVTFTATEGGIVDTETVDKIVEDITNEEYEAGDSVEIVLDDATVIPAEVLKAIIAYNELLAADDEEPLSLVVEMDTYTWTITDITSTTPIDLGITFGEVATDAKLIEKLADGNKSVTFNIAHDGEFGFDAKLSFNVSTDYAGKKVSLYWDNNGKFELIGSCVAGKDGSISYDMTHASDYVLVIEGTKTVEPDSTITPTPDNTGNGGVGDGGQQVKPGDSANLVLLFAVAAVAGAVVLTRKKTVIE